MDGTPESEPRRKGTAPTLQTVDRALSFLEHVAACQEPPTVQQVADSLGLNITTGYHMMRTLAKRGYLRRLSGGKLVVGEAIGPLFRSYRLRLNVNQELTDIVRALSAATGETAFYSVPAGESVLLEILVEGSHQLRVGGLFVGSTGNEHRRASARAILPFLDEARREAILAKSLANLQKSEARQARKAFDAAIAETRQRGWSSDGGDIVQGITSIGWPVFDGYGAIAGSIGLIVPTLRLERSGEMLMAEGAKAAGRVMDVLRNSMTG
ncbi:IclR family transcriptional regulator [Marinibaculum pumilum]|uniref:IclR family transcriptional regulator n=1 Tax=Marinibaculum pumilum TaxID=1766165 RepID=A0ABV7KTM6_9PROT